MGHLTSQSVLFNCLSLSLFLSFPLFLHFSPPFQVWFKNRRAKFRKQERLNQAKGSNSSNSTSGVQSPGGSSNGGHTQLETSSNGSLTSNNNNNNNGTSNGNTHNPSNNNNNSNSKTSLTHGLNGTTSLELKPIRSLTRGHEFLGVPSY